MTIPLKDDGSVDFEKAASITINGDYFQYGNTADWLKALHSHAIEAAAKVARNRIAHGAHPMAKEASTIISQTILTLKVKADG